MYTKWLQGQQKREANCKEWAAIQRGCEFFFFLRLFLRFGWADFLTKRWPLGKEKVRQRRRRRGIERRVEAKKKEHERTTGTEREREMDRWNGRVASVWRRGGSGVTAVSEWESPTRKSGATTQRQWNESLKFTTFSLFLCAQGGTKALSKKNEDE